MNIHLDICLCFHLIFKNLPQSSIILISIDKMSRHIWSLSSGDYYQNTKNIREHSYFSLECRGSIGYSLHSCMSSDGHFVSLCLSFHTCKPRGLGVTCNRLSQSMVPCPSADGSILVLTSSNAQRMGI